MINRTTPENISEVYDNEVFVFGSNLSGIHGAGAAKMALNFGAVMRRPTGIQGNSYAIPTKDAQIKYTLEINEIREYVAEFINYAKSHPDKTFLVTEIACGLASMHPNQIAPLFLKAKDIQNIHLPKRFWDVINKIPEYRIVENHGGFHIQVKYRYETGMLWWKKKFFNWVPSRLDGGPCIPYSGQLLGIPHEPLNTFKEAQEKVWKFQEGNTYYEV